jgi:hypothetical protein
VGSQRRQVILQEECGVRCSVSCLLTIQSCHRSESRCSHTAAGSRTVYFW